MTSTIPLHLFDAQCVPESYDVLCEFSRQFVEPHAIHVDIRTLYQNFDQYEDPVIKKEEMRKMEEHTIDDSVKPTAALLTYIDYFAKESKTESPACDRYLHRVQVTAEKYLNLQTLELRPDALSAIYVPKEVSNFVYNFGGDIGTIVVNEDVLHDASMEDLLRIESECNHDVLISIETLIREELQMERNSKPFQWKIMPNSTLEFDGVLYNRVQITKPFLPLNAIAYHSIQFKFKQTCQVILECIVMPKFVRHAFCKYDTISIWEMLKNKKIRCPHKNNNFRMFVQMRTENLERNVTWFNIVSGMIGRRYIYQEKEEYQLEYRLNECENKLIEEDEF